MKRIARPALFVTLFFLFAFSAFAQRPGPLPAPPQNPQDAAQASVPAPGATITIPAGAKIQLVITTPVFMRSAKAGQSIYGQTAFPIAVNNQMAIPAGTYVQGEIDSLSKLPFLGLAVHRQVEIHYTKLIFANGYEVDFPPVTADSAAGQTAQKDDVVPAISSLNMDVGNDVLFDNGTQIEIALEVPLTLDAASVQAAARMGHAPPLKFKSASLCVPTSGSPGTPDTVIPGTPGTMDIDIPQGPGLPDVVIPGTPGTPDTVIPGTPDTPPIPCGASGIPDPKPVQRTEAIELVQPMYIGLTPLDAGTYQFDWASTSPDSPVTIAIKRNKKNPVATVQGREMALDDKAIFTEPITATNADGTVALQGLRFSGQTFELLFDPIAAKAVSPGEATKQNIADNR